MIEIDEGSLSQCEKREYLLMYLHSFTEVRVQRCGLHPIVSAILKRSKVMSFVTKGGNGDDDNTQH